MIVGYRKSYASSRRRYWCLSCVMLGVLDVQSSDNSVSNEMSCSQQLTV